MIDNEEQVQPAKDISMDLDAESEKKDCINESEPVLLEEEVKDELELLKEENQRLTDALNQQKDQYLRTVAEMDNLRKRMTREREEYIKYASLPLLKKVLAVMDDLERAVRLSADNQDYAALQKGLDMINKKMQDIIKDEMVEEIPALNQPFDPKYHQALTVEPNDDYSDNVIFEELQKGYTLHGRVIRPSLVKVSG